MTDCMIIRTCNKQKNFHKHLLCPLKLSYCKTSCKILFSAYYVSLHQSFHSYGTENFKTTLRLCTSWATNLNIRFYTPTSTRMSYAVSFTE